MANIAVQRIKREFKEVLKSEEVCCHVCLSVLLLSLFISLPSELYVSDASLAVSFLITQLLALANCVRHGGASGFTNG